MEQGNTKVPGQRLLWVILFWGSLWGLAEATLGFVLHAAAAAVPGLQGFVMFPIAFVLMERAVAASGRPWAAFAASWVAAAVKLADLLLPGAVPLRVLNPAAALLMEGAAVWVALAWCASRQVRVSGWHALLASLLWRTFFLGDQVVLASLSIPAGLVTNGWKPALEFLLVEGAANALLIMALYAARHAALYAARHAAWHPARHAVAGRMRRQGTSFPDSAHVPLAVWSGGLLVLAVVAQLLL